MKYWNKLLLIIAGIWDIIMYCNTFLDMYNYHHYTKPHITFYGIHTYIFAYFKCNLYVIILLEIIVTLSAREKKHRLVTRAVKLKHLINSK